MGMQDSAVFTAGSGFVYLGNQAATPPTPSAIGDYTPLSAVSGFTLLGHTSRETLPEFGFEGGETEVKGTWQNAAFKTVTPEAPVDYMTLQVHQLDATGLQLYYAVNNASSTPGEFKVAAPSTSAIRKSLLIIVVDGDINVGFYAPKCDIRRDEAISMAVDNFTSLPIKATFLQHDWGGEDGTEMFRWISPDTLIVPS